MSRPPSIYLVAAERSGDLLGAGLIEALRTETGGEVRLAGIGGRAMADAGVPTAIDISGLSIVGWFDGLRVYKLVRRAVDAAVADILAKKPDAVVLIDSWGFTIRVAQAVRAVDPSIRLIKYVGPQVFATRPGRARVMAESVDQLLTILDLDTPFYEPYDLPVTFVGNPTLERLPQGDGAAFRARHAIAPKANVLVVLFGSRTSEIARLYDIFADAVARLCAARPDLTVVIPIAEPVESEVRARLEGDARLAGAIVIEETDKADAFAAADVSLACSGTVVMELATAGVPTVTGYWLGWLSWSLLRLLKLYKPKYITLVNMVADEELVREFVQTKCTAPRLADAVLDLLDDPARRTELARRLRETTARIRGDGQASRRAAQAVLAGLGTDT